MATHDYVIDNSTGANVRADINNVLQAILTNNSNSSAPSTTAAYQWWADTNTNVLKIRNSANNAWITLFTLAGGVDVDAASNFAAAVTFTDDVTFTGASANIVFDKSDNQLEFADNAKAEFGTGGDLEIYHSGSHSHITDSGTGNLRVQTNNLRVENAAGTENQLLATENDGIELYYDNAPILETESWGIMVTGTVEADQFNLLDSDGTTQQIRIGASGDLRLFHQSSENIIGVNTVGQDIFFKSSSSSALDTTSFVVRTDGSVTHPDNIKMKFGTGDDLQIYHDGTGSRIHSPSHPLYLRVGGQFGVFKGDGSESKILAEDDGQVKLHFDNEIKLETLTDGAQCRGVMHVLSQDGNVIQHTEALYCFIASGGSKTITLTGMIGSGRFVLGGYASAGQGAIALNIFLGGAMFATQHYNVNVLQNSAMQNTSISLSKNSTSYVITISNTSSSQGIGLSGFLESTGSQMSFAIS